MKNQNIRWILLAAIILIFVSMQNTMPKESVADLENKTCVVDADCPCWGVVNNETDVNAYGIGQATCNTETGYCDTTFCVDVEPVGEWLKDNPYAWAKDNILMVSVLVGLAILVLAWPKI